MINPTKALIAIQNFNPDIFITGQTKLAETIVHFLKSRELLVIRYSGFYGMSDRGHAYTQIGNEVLRGRRFALTTEEIGYAPDSPKESELMLSFINNPRIIEAVAKRDKKILEEEIDSVNIERKKPINKTGFFRFLWT